MVANPVSNFYDNLPSELKVIPHWCVWIYKVTPYGKTKVPFNPLTNRPADSTDPSTWVSFELACANVGRYEGLGFFFSKSIKKVGIDLDYTDDPKLIESHIKIFNATSSYAERSPSGKGLHIICSGVVERGVKSASKKVEMYDQWRFFTMTGDVVRQAPIVNEQFIIDALFNDIGKLKDVEGFDPKDGPEIEDDQTIYNRASNASNGELFSTLWAGKWQDDYQSQSEADQALINILAFYSNNFAQVARMFRKSGLGQRDKAKRDNYVMPTVKRAFDQKTPTVESIMNMSADFNVLLEAQKERASGNAEALQPEAQTTPVGKGDKPTASRKTYKFVPPETSREWALKPPSGLVAEVAAFIYQSARLPVEEIALAGSLGFLAGMCGRAINVSGTGLNLYLTMLAESGRGKEAMASGVDKLIASMAMTNPNCEAMIGPSTISSGQALLPYLEHTSKSFVSILTEFDKMLLQLTQRVPNSAQAALKANLLSFYSKSGVGSVVRPAIFADRTKNSNNLLSPAVTLLGECTIEKMKQTVNPEIVTDGLLPRFINIVYDGPRVVDNEHIKKAPDIELVKKLVALYNSCAQLNAQNRVFDVVPTSEAEEYLKEVNIFLRDRMNDPARKQFNELWNRCFVNILKIAAICSITIDNGVLAYGRGIELEHAKWATAIVFNSANWWISNFETHEIGEQNNDISQVRDVRRKLKAFFDMPRDKQIKYFVSDKMASEWIVTHVWLSTSTAKMASFRTDKMGHSFALKRAIQSMIDNGELVNMQKTQNYAHNYGTDRLAYKIMNLIDEGV